MSKKDNSNKKNERPEPVHDLQGGVPNDQEHSDDTGMSGADQVESTEQLKAEVHEVDPETVADLTEDDLKRIAEEVKALPIVTNGDSGEEIDDETREALADAIEALKVAEKEFRKYVKRDGGFRKGLSGQDQSKCRHLMKRMGKKQLTWDQNILPM